MITRPDPIMSYDLGLCEGVLIELALEPEGSWGIVWAVWRSERLGSMKLLAKPKHLLLDFWKVRVKYCRMFK